MVEPSHLGVAQRRQFGQAPNLSCYTPSGVVVAKDATSGPRPGRLTT